MTIIFQIDGGIGKSVMATAVCRAIKTQYPKCKLIVITGYPEVFLCNPFVDRAFNHNNLSYFYEEHIEGQEVKMMVHNPYLESDFIMLRGHLIQVWCAMNGIKYNGEIPELFINERERAFYINQFGKFEKPIMVLQTNGGAANQQNKYSWSRDLPHSIAQYIVNQFANDYHVLHIRRDDQLALQNTIQVKSDFRALAVLISISTKRLLIDSFAQHVAAALGLPSVVCWIGNTPQQFGYPLHTNVIAHAPTIKPELRNSVYTKYDISGHPIGFPYNSEQEIFNAEQIVALLKQDQSPKPAPAQNTNMVDRRLAHLAGKIEVDSIKQILDIGSWHLGQSIEFAGIFKQARIDAFEPVPESYELCLKNREGLSEADKERIRVHNIAISDKTGEVSFYPIDGENSSVPNIGASSMFKFIDGLNGTPFGQNLTQKEIKVKAETLDKWCAENKIKKVDIMWVDVQGAELLVFKGA